MSDTTTPHQAQKRPPITLDGSHLGDRVILTWASGASEGTAVGTLESVHHEMEPYLGIGGAIVTMARLAGMPEAMTITGWGEAQPLEPDTTPNN